MLKLSMGMGVSVTQEVKISLKMMLKIKQELVSEVPAEATKGLEGMKNAHEILKKRGAIGILIGGLSEKVWEQGVTGDDLFKHKDVDVLVLNDDFLLSEKFEGGVDWWLPYNGKINVGNPNNTDYSEKVRWFENGNGVILSFGANLQKESLEPGLYIPDPSWVRDMRVSESLANIQDKYEYDETEEEKFRTKIIPNKSDYLSRNVFGGSAEGVISKSHVSIENFSYRKVKALRRSRWQVNEEVSKILDQMESEPEDSEEQDFDLSGLTSLPLGFRFPEEVHGNLDLSGLTSLPEGIVFPKKITGTFNLSGLTNLPEGIVFPEEIGSDDCYNTYFYLYGLTSLPEGVVFPKIIHGTLVLSGLTSLPEGVVFPEEVTVTLNLNSVVSLPKLVVFPKKTLMLDLIRINKTDRERLIQERPDLFVGYVG